MDWQKLFGPRNLHEIIVMMLASAEEDRQIERYTERRADRQQQDRAA
jgi:hypothetical protein